MAHPKLKWRGPADACALFNHFENRILRNLYLSPRFQREYAAGSVARRGGLLSGFFRRDWLEQRRPRGFELVSEDRTRCEHPASSTGEDDWTLIWEPHEGS